MSSIINRTTEYINISDCAFPLPFSQQLEFSSPARGTWNIVHTGMLIPESHQIFVCAKGCLRGVVLTAAEMGAMGRYSALEIREENVLNGDMEEMMVNGVADIISRLEYRPRSILLFISCQHFFLAYDQQMVFRRLADMFPDIEFTDCYMIPTLRKSGITPDQKMRIQMYSMLKPRVTDPGKINIIGSNRPLSDGSELKSYLKEQSYSLNSIHDCRTFDDYLALSEARLNIVYEPIAIKAAEDMEKRLGIPYVYLPSCFRTEDIRDNYRRLSGILNIPEIDTDLWEKEVDTAVEAARAVTGDRAVTIDYTFTFRPLNMARFLVEKGFNVTDIYIDAFIPEEEQDYAWLKDNCPEIRIHPTARPSMRFYTENRPDALALGQKAALFTGTDYFVNIAEGGGIWGYGGVIELLQLMTDACLNSKDRRETVQKKGTQMRSVLDEEGYTCELMTGENESVTNSNSSSNSGGMSFGTDAAKQYAASLVPTYSSDEFGICSALYELGGMVVMHDASGCNSTYTTHDEPRWYDQESMIYISAISEMEAIMGDDEKLIHDVEDAAAELKPDFAAIVGAPIPYMIGTDFTAIAGILENELGIPVWGFPANGMQGYGKGISMAIRTLTEYYSGDTEESRLSEGEACEIREIEPLKVNLIGATPLDFSINGSIEAINDWVNTEGMTVNANLGMTGSIEDYRKAALADVNLVLSYGGLAAARYMENKYGIPYICGVPAGKAYAHVLAERIRDIASGKGVDEAEKAAPPDITSGVYAVVLGEPVNAVSLARAIEAEYGIRAVAVATTDFDEELLGKGDLSAVNEAEVVKVLKDIKPALVVADPFYEVLCCRAISGTDIEFCRRPHEAFSGRIFERENQNLINHLLEDSLGINRILNRNNN